jgi:hypothetical protein
MPELSRFYGIVIRMYYDDHGPPHFHAYYGDMEVVVDVRTLAVLAGKLSSRAMGLVIEWASLHQQELIDAWQKASQMRPPGKIDPLP